MSARAPVLVGLAVLVAGAVVASEARTETSTVVPAADDQPGVHMPAVPAADVLASTWYCAAGTAQSRLADHTVVVVNTGDEPVTGTVSIYSGKVAPPPAPVDTTGEAAGGDRPASAEDDAATGEGEARSGEAASAEDDAATGEGEARSGEAASAEDEAASDEAADAPATTGGDPSVADPWAGAAAPGLPAAAQPFEVAPHGRYALRLATVVDAPLAAALVEAAGAVAVEHAITGRTGRDIGPCASSASEDWYMAWGSTLRGARELLVLFNPFPSTAMVDITFSTDDGIREPVRYQGLPIPAGSVVGLDVGDDVSREEQVAATVRTRSGSIVVERIVSLDGSRGPYPRGLALAMGAPRARQAWGFADGRLTDDHQEWIVVYNPTRRRAEVDVGVRPPREAGAPPPTPFRLSVRPGRYEVIAYAADERVPTDSGHATLVRSRNGVPIVAERVQAAPAGADDSDVSVSLGAAFADRTWYFGSSGRDDRGTTRFIAYNPDPDEPATVSVTAWLDGKAVRAAGLQGIEVGPGARTEVNIPADVVDRSAAYTLTSDVPVLAERLITNRLRVIESVGPGILGDADPLSVTDVDLDR